MTYVSDNSAQCSVLYSGVTTNVVRTITGWTANGYEISYEFTNIPAGSHWFIVNCTANSSIDAKNLTNQVTLEEEGQEYTLTGIAEVIISEFSGAIMPVLFALIVPIALISRRRKFNLLTIMKKQNLEEGIRMSEPNEIIPQHQTEKGDAE
jgi:hypothetical protein